MKIFRICLILLISFVAGCHSRYVSKTTEFQTKEEFLDYLMEGYLKRSKTLYLLGSNGGRLEKLYKVLGLKDCDRIYTANKGELLIFDKYARHRSLDEFYTLVLSADAPPKLMRSPEELWDGNCRVFYYSDEEGLQCLDKRKFKYWSSPPIHFDLNDTGDENEYLKFHNGHIISGRFEIYLDEDGRFLCYRKLDRQLKHGAYISHESEPTYIISVDNPKMQVRSRLKWFPDSMVINNDRLYLGTITGRKTILGTMAEKRTLPLFHFEVFDIIGDGELKYLKDYYVDVPWAFATHTAYMFDYDYWTHSQNFTVVRNFPFSCSEYLYSYDNNSFKEIPDVYCRFINPAILKNSVQYVDLEKLRAN